MVSAFFFSLPLAKKSWPPLISGGRTTVSSCSPLLSHRLCNSFFFRNKNNALCQEEGESKHSTNGFSAIWRWILDVDHGRKWNLKDLTTHSNLSMMNSRFEVLLN